MVNLQLERITSNLSFKKAISSDLSPQDGGRGGGGGSTTETSSTADIGARLRLPERDRLGDMNVTV
jgi:hypothetical protein